MNSENHPIGLAIAEMCAMLSVGRTPSARPSSGDDTLFSNLPAIATSAPYLAVWVLSVPRAREVRKSDQRGHLVVSRLNA
jgi:hypothetical protein